MPDIDNYFSKISFVVKDNVFASGINFVYMLLMFPENTEALQG